MLTRLELAHDAAETDHCGSCTRCLDACPTSAFASPYVLDARKCIANWTIETAEPSEVIDPSQIGQHLFGCDICQEVCPWNRKITPTRHDKLKPRPENVRPNMNELVALDEEAFGLRFPKSAVKRVTVHQVRQTVAAIKLGQGVRPDEQ